MDFVQRISQPFKRLLQDRSACLRLLLYFLISLVFLGNFIKPEYATDTYADVMLPAGELIENFLRGGRLFTLLFFMLFRGLHISVQLVNILSFLLAIIALVSALYLLESILRKHFIRHKIWPFIISLLVILNPFIIELFLFIEKGIMVTGILCCVIAIYYFNQYLDDKSKKSLLKSFLFTIIAAFCYQGIVGLFIALAALLVVLKSEQWSTFFKNTFLAVCIYALGPILNIIFIKLFSSGGRTGGEIILSESFSKILSGTKDMFNLFDILPASCFWGALIFIILLWAIYCLKQHKFFQRLALLTFAQIIYLFLVTYLAAIAPQAIQNTAAIWIVPRSTYVFASYLGFVCIILLHNYPQITVKKWWRILAGLAIGIFIFFQFYGFNKVILSHYSLNTIDRLRAEQLTQLITAYEAQYNTTITNIMPANDARLSYSYDGIFSRGDINVSSFSTNWSDVTALNFWSQRHFHRQDPTSDWQDYCSSHDWHHFDTAQVKFSGDTLQVCWY